MSASFISLLRNTATDLATMDHSAMNDSHAGDTLWSGMENSSSQIPPSDGVMHGMMDSMASSPSPTVMPNHHSMQMSMQMWFQATDHVVLWFREWKVSSRGP